MDGKIHEFQKEYDENRDMVLAGLGLRTIRILNEELKQNMKGVVQKILIVLES
jgi:very-short-patch-repair endonuclease